MAHRAYLYIGNVFEFVGKNLGDLAGVCQHASEVSLLQTLLVGDAPRIIPSVIFDSAPAILADRAGSIARVLALLDRLGDGEIAERDAFVATAGMIREFLRALPRTTHFLLEPAEVFADSDFDAETLALVVEIETTTERVARAIRGDDEAFLAEIRRDWRRHIDSFWSEHLYFSFTKDRSVGLPEVRVHGAWIAPGGRATCAECYLPLDGAAVHDATGSRRELRTLHVGCALWYARDVLRVALRDVRDDIVVEPWIERWLDADLAMYGANEPLFEQLLDRPDDAGVLATFAERLAGAGDPYAEVITTDLARTKQPYDRELLKRQSELHKRFAPGRHLWGVGFLRHLSLHESRALDAPSHALVTEMHLFVQSWDGTDFERAAAWMPRSVRHLVLSSERALPPTGVATLVAALPRVQRLELGENKYRLAGIADLLRALAPISRSLVELAVRPHDRADIPAICSALVDAGWLSRVDRVVLNGIHPSVMRAIIPVPDQRKVTIEDPPIETPTVATPSIAVGATIEHTGKPEWGAGKVVSVRDGKIEIAFGATRRTFKSGAVFLRVVDAKG